MRDEFSRLNRHWETLSPREILEEVFRLWHPSRVVATSSFQDQGIPFLHMLSEEAPGVRILFLDTGFHFPETLEFRDRIASLLDLKVVNLRPDPFPPEPTYSRDTDACCALNKMRPLRQALRGVDVWLAGVRRDQTEHRRSLQIVSRQPTGVIKVCPMLNWTGLEVARYLIRHHHLPQHPLTSQGYHSIGCRPCTTRAERRNGRWHGEEKTECGIHCPSH